MKTKFIMPTGELTERDFPLWKTPYNHDRDFESERTALYTPEPSLTKQEFVEEQDINTILNRFTRTGETPPVVLPEHFADLRGRTTHFEMATKIAEANKLFYELPAETRAKHLNDPTRWADAVVRALDYGDRDSLEELGIDVQPTEKPQAAKSSPPATPAVTPDDAAPGASKEAKKGGTPKPPSDDAKT